MKRQRFFEASHRDRAPHGHAAGHSTKCAAVVYLPRGRTILGLVLLGATTTFASAGEKEEDPSRLTVARIYSERDFEMKGFSGRWLPEQAAYTTLEASSDPAGGRDIVRYDLPGDDRRVMVSAAELVPAAETEPLAIDDYAWSADLSLLLIYTNSKRVWRQKTRGDYWVLDRGSRQLWKLGGKARPASLMFAKFSLTGKQVAYVRDRDIYVEDLLDHSIRRLTHAESETIINGTFDWVYEEELGLRDGFRFSPDGRFIAFWQIDTKGVRQIPLVNNTAALYPKVTWIPYPKVGQNNSRCRVGVVTIASGETRWLRLGGDRRDRYVARMDWADNSQELLVQQLNRLQNRNRVMLANVSTQAVTTIFTEKDEAWVDIHDELNWLDDGRRFTWISERDGWRHVYLASRAGGEITLVTPGEFDVIRLLHVDEANQLLYFLASPHDPTQQFLYRVGFDGGDLTRVTPKKARGTHDYRIAPGGGWAIHTSSTYDDPPVTRLVKLPSHERVRSLAGHRKIRRRIGRLDRRPVEFFRVDIGSGTQLDGWCLKPPDFDPAKKYPLLVYVYGEPAGRTVIDHWGGSSGLWHLMLAQQGYLVMSFDNRGTKVPRGRAWRKSIYGKIGILAPDDQAAAVRSVIEQRPYVDEKRVGVWGWSGGGSMTLHAIFKYPNLYDTAIAVAPVPNQRYYDTIYQERYMGLPGGNVEGYRDGSPINFVGGLEGNLLLIHGTGDDNCHYQTTEMLINELIRLDKPFSMMAYPNRTHAIREGRNTTLHLRRLMTRYLLEHLPPGGVKMPH